MSVLSKKEAIIDLIQKSRTIYLDERITAETAKEFGLAMAWLNSQNDEEVKLIIDCGGGSATAGLNMYDMVMFSNAPVVGIVYGQASSMASVILQACKKRYALQHAGLCIHYLKTYEIPLNDLDEDPEKALKSVRERQKSINDIYHKRTCKSFEEIKLALKEDKLLSSKEALEFGLIDEIITSYKI